MQAVRRAYNNTYALQASGPELESSPYVQILKI